MDIKRTIEDLKKEAAAQGLGLDKVIEDLRELGFEVTPPASEGKSTKLSETEIEETERFVRGLGGSGKGEESSRVK